MIPAIFINCKRDPFIRKIMDKENPKQYETRTRNTMKKLMESHLGERFLLVETGNGEPVVRCSAIIDEVISVTTPEQWEEYRKTTCVPVGSEYDWKPETKIKWLYHLTDVQPVEPFVLPRFCRRHGIVWAEFNNEYQELSKPVNIE